jgi:hypothetical protein
MSAIEIAWTVVGIIVSIGITAGFAVIGLAPPEFKLARISFWGSSIILAGMDIVWGTETEHSFMWRAIVSGLIGATIFVLLPEGLRLIHRREVLVLVPPGMPPSVPATTQQPDKPPAPKTEVSPEPPAPKTESSKTAPPANQEAAKPIPAPEVPSTKNLVGQLAIFIDEGSQIQTRFIASNDPQAELEEANEWVARVQKYLVENLDTSYAIQFRNSAGNAWMGMPVNHSVVGGGYWQNIEGKKNCLNEFIRDLRPHSQ